MTYDASAFDSAADVDGFEWLEIEVRSLLASRPEAVRFDTTTPPSRWFRCDNPECAGGLDIQKHVDAALEEGRAQTGKQASGEVIIDAVEACPGPIVRDRSSVDCTNVFRIFVRGKVK